MDTTPLESYFNGHPRPQELSFQEVYVERFDSSCWRGYVGYWKIENDFLYLERLLYCGYKSQDEIPLSLIFKEQKPPIKASWYTGDLKLPEGRILLVEIHEKDVIITVENGRVISERTVDNKESAATRSRYDVGWVGIVDSPPKDDLKWLDARLIRTVELGKQFVTRGTFLGAKVGRPPTLMIPCTPTTPREEIPIHYLPEDFSEAGGPFVEIGAHFEKSNGDHLLHVDWVRHLVPGETIHHPSFKAPPNVKPVWPCIERSQKEVIN